MMSRQCTNEASKAKRGPNASITSKPSKSSEAAAALLELQKSSSFKDGSLGPFSSPSKQSVDARTGLVHGTMRVEHVRGSGGRTMLRLEYLLEQQQTQQQDGTAAPMLVATQYQAFVSQSQVMSPTAQKNNALFSSSGKDWMNEKRHFAIAEYNKQNQVLGQVSLSPLHQQVVAFSVTVMDQLDSCILYKVHSLPKIFSNVAPPRQIEVVRFTERAKRAVTMEGNGTAVKLESNTLYRGLLNECSELLQPNGEAAPYKVSCDSDYLSLFHSERPYIKIDTKAPTLNMKGRGRVASSKNTQLVDQDGVVCLQVAKCDHNTYHVDFRAPFNAFQAFAFGIAQLAL